MRTLCLLAAALMAIASAVSAQVADPRVCGAPLRDADGSIARSSTAKAEFRRLHACPSTQRTAEFRALDMRDARRGDWRAVEHGFDDSKTPNV